MNEEKKTSPLPLIGTILLLALIGAAMCYAYFSPARRSCAYAADGETEKAGELYEAWVKDNQVEAFFLRLMVPRSAEYVLQAFIRGEVTYEDASGRLMSLAKLEAPLGNARRTAEKVQEIYGSVKAWDLASELEKKGDTRGAMLAYRSVSEKDARYARASEKADALEETYKSEVLASIGEPGTVHAYEQAKSALEEALSVLPDDEGLKAAHKTLKETFALKIKTETLPVAADYIEKGYYYEAITMLEKALTYNEQDAEVKTLLAKATTRYETFVRSQVSICLHNGDREGAVQLLDRVREELPEDVVFAQLQSAV